jgi:hypothetical protein
MFYGSWMNARRTLLESLASSILAANGIAAIWLLSLDAAHADRIGYEGAANAILELAEGVRLASQIKDPLLSEADMGVFHPADLYESVAFDAAPAWPIKTEQGQVILTKGGGLGTLHLCRPQPDRGHSWRCG